MTTKAQPSGLFKYVFIPSIDSEPISSLEADKSGGLSNDALSKNAKKYFSEQNAGHVGSQIENATPEEKKQMAKIIRDQYLSSATKSGSKEDKAMSQLAQMDDDALCEIMKASQSASTCEITALTIPTNTNNYQAVSMYGNDQGRTRDLPFNKRATALLKACGHGLPPDASNEDGKPSGIYGDVFVGRCIDNEMKDIWERIDFTVEEVEGNLDDIEWCRTARKKGGGGGRGSGAAAASLSGLMGNALKGPSDTSSEKKEKGYAWSQTNEEVEIKISVASGTKAKYVKVKFGRNTLKVSVAGQTVCEGETWSDVVVDDCTYTIQDDPESTGGGRELCITLCKQKESEHWNYAVM